MSNDKVPPLNRAIRRALEQGKPVTAHTKQRPAHKGRRYRLGRKVRAR